MTATITLPRAKGPVQVLVGDVAFALWRIPSLTWFAAVFAFGFDRAWSTRGTIVFLFAWPLFFVLGGLAVYTAYRAMSRHRRTRTFAPLCVLALTAGSLVSPADRTWLQLLLPSWVCAGYLLLVWPGLATRGNQRLFGLATVALAVLALVTLL